MCACAHNTPHIYKTSLIHSLHSCGCQTYGCYNLPSPSPPLTDSCRTWKGAWLRVWWSATSVTLWKIMPSRALVSTLTMCATSCTRRRPTALSCEWQRGKEPVNLDHGVGVSVYRGWTYTRWSQEEPFTEFIPAISLHQAWLTTAAFQFLQLETQIQYIWSAESDTEYLWH